MFLSKQEQDELNMHFQKYAEGEERKKDLYEGYIKGILLIGCKSAAKTITEEMEAERQRRWVWMIVCARMIYNLMDH